MNLRLPEGWESFVDSQIRSGRFATGEEVMGEALKLLEAHIRDEAETLEGIRKGLADVEAGRTQPLAEAFAEIRRELGLKPGS
ncbi:ribbon-helix-helix domain-containing protein [Tundrisphaera lichenicola]|uniref:ribbon-helix-helix domain-containing protein n=1 Tax=Tundrisphaera lichenicola TaxID=2029860 RepID=UPI003EB9F295